MNKKELKINALLYILNLTTEMKVGIQAGVGNDITRMSMFRRVNALRNVVEKEIKRIK